MSDVVIQAENLGKKYLIGHQAANERYVALRDVVSQKARRISQMARDLLCGRPIVHGETLEEVWALKGVSFEIKQGDVVGIIGRNGAGKSTLFKILSRITEPTEGRVRIRGRVASLLEVGTGFHPELTGRENIFLNGAILGMTREEIKRKFDEIVAFADIEKFLDTPVKRYSSGMYVRLAFAVAAHLEPEILLVDEVLAVGDFEFQKRCLGKLDEVASSGRTVLFVSHNMVAIESLCMSVQLLQNGRMVDAGPPAAVIRKYLRDNSSLDADVDLTNNLTRPTGMKPVFRRLRITDASGIPEVFVKLASDIRFEVHFVSCRILRDTGVAVALRDHLGQVVVRCYSKHQYAGNIDVSGYCVVVCRIGDCRLAPGSYTVQLVLVSDKVVVDRVECAARFEIVPSDIFKTGKLPQNAGVYLPHVQWEVSEEVLIEEPRPM